MSITKSGDNGYSYFSIPVLWGGLCSSSMFVLLSAGTAVLTIHCLVARGI